MNDHYLISDSDQIIKRLILALMVLVVVVGIGVCWFIDSRPTTIVQNYTNLYAQQADVWIVDGVRWRTVVEGKVFELKDMP